MRKYEYEVNQDITLTVVIADPFNLSKQERLRIAELVLEAMGRTPDDFWVEEFPDLPREDWPLFVSAGCDVVAEFHPVE